MNSFWRKLMTLKVLNCPLHHSLLKNSTFAVYTMTENTAPALLKSCVFSTNLPNIRYKSKKAQVDSDDESEVFDDDSSLSRDSKVVKFSTTSMRTDAVLKSALGIARNKIETMFYESKIRVNGKKVLKKSASVRQGDEIDVIKAVSPKNPEHLYVSRVEIISVAAKEDSISVTARRFKTLLIESYEEDPHKAPSPNDGD